MKRIESTKKKPKKKTHNSKTNWTDIVNLIKIHSSEMKVSLRL